MRLLNLDLRRRWWFRSVSWGALATATLWGSAIAGQQHAGSPIESSSANAPPQRLDLGQRVERTIGPGEQLTFSILAESRQFIRLAVDGFGTRLRAQRQIAGAAAAAQRVRRSGDRDAIVWSWIAESTGEHRFSVVSLEPSASRAIALVVTERRSARDVDAGIVEAEQVIEDVTDNFTRAPADRPVEAGAETRLSAVAARAVAAGDTELAVRARFLIARMHADAGRSAQGERVLNEIRDACRSARLACESTAELRLAQLYFSTGRLDPGADRLAAAMTLREHAGDVVGQVDVLVVKAAREAARSEHDRARATAERALTLARQAGDRRSEGDALNIQALAHFNQGNYPTALELYQSALSVRRGVGDEVGEGQSLSNLGVLYSNLGEPRQAIAHYTGALAIRRRLGNVQAIANTLHNLGVEHANLGEHEHALRLINEALGMWRSSGGRRGEAFALQAMAASYASSGDPKRALAYLEEAVPMFRAVTDPRAEALAVITMAGIHVRMGALDRALAAYQQAVELSRGAAVKREMSLALLGVASIERRQGHVDAALAGAREALLLLEQLGQRREVGRAWAEVAMSEVLAGRDADADVSLRAALGHFEAVEDRAEQGRVRLLLAESSERLGRPDAALAHIRAGLDQLDSVRADQLAESLSLSTFVAHKPYFDQAIGVLMRLHERWSDRGYDREAFAVSERRRARRLLDMVSVGDVQPRASESLPLVTDLRRAQELVTSKAARLTRLLSLDTANRYQVEQARRQVTESIERLDFLRAQLRQQDPELSELHDPVALDVATVQARLDPAAVLVEYAQGDDRSVGFALTAEGLTTFLLPSRAEVESLVRQARLAATARADRVEREDLSARQTRIDAADRRFRALGRSLSTMLLGPVTGMLAGKTRMLIIGDGLLDALPFAALPFPESMGTPTAHRGTVLASSLEVVTLPSASVAEALRSRAARRPRPTDRVAVFADPVFSVQDNRVPTSARSASSTTLGAPLRLRFSRVEANRIAGLAPRRTTVWSDFSATRRRALDRSLGDFGYVHLATHAVVDEEHPQLSRVELAAVDEQGRLQDGALRLLDIHNLHLNARLVVLSGCDTALGAQVAGEGLVGLASGFLRAGAAAVVASLWPVDDRATEAFMSAFYDELLRRDADPVRALHAAQRAFQRNPRWQAPYDWAGWVLIGAPTPMD